MKSNGFDKPLDSEGRGFIGCIAALVLMAALIFIGIKLGPIYYTNYVFEEDLKNLTSQVGSHFTENSQIIVDILELAKKNNITLKQNDVQRNIKIDRYAGQIHIIVTYYEPVDFLFVRRTFRFQIKLSSFTAS